MGTTSWKTQLQRFQLRLSGFIHISNSAHYEKARGYLHRRFVWEKTFGAEAVLVLVLVLGLVKVQSNIYCVGGRKLMMFSNDVSQSLAS